jgi:hypothetical protein
MGDIYSDIVERIVREQETIIGPIAIEQAQKVPGLKVDLNKHEISFQGNRMEAVENLIEKYRELFGQASVEACKEAVSGIISQVPNDKVPHLLR